MQYLIFLLIGVLGGICGGLFGIGGGIVMVPAMIYLLGFDQKLAQGTSLLALLAPVGIFAVLNYHAQGKVDFRAGAFIAGAFVLGSIFGSKIALDLPDDILRKVFAVFLVLVAIQLFLKK